MVYMPPICNATKEEDARVDIFSAKNWQFLRAVLFDVHGIKVESRKNIFHVCMEGLLKNEIFDGSQFMGFSNQPYYDVCRMSSF